ncbi:MAG: hypothetical protein EOP54_07750 [Sphingobacteriales bacterium]|nr:MAG: hypothetical protein EOP54_07750 [Sphingobacteriales bacterium]
MKTHETVKLYWPVNHAMLQAIELMGWRRFPEHYLCNPVLNEGYAVQISQELDAVACPVAYICEFELLISDLETFSIKQSSNIYHQELEINARNLISLNDAILGQISVKRAFKKQVQNLQDT